MSSENSRNCLDSGNAFKGDSPSPSSPEGRQSLEISWTESSHHGSASQGRKVAEEGERDDEEVSSWTRDSGAVQTLSPRSLFVMLVG